MATDEPTILSDDEEVEPILSGDEGVEPSGPAAIKYTPPVEFQLIDKPPLIQEHASDSTELWLVRIQDSQLGPEDFKEKQVTMSLKPLDSKLGDFQTSKGIQYDILDLHQMEGVQPFAFLPKVNGGSLNALRISRQVAFVRSLDPDVLMNQPAMHNDDLLEHKDAALQERSSSKKHQRSSLQMSRDGALLGDSVRLQPEETQVRSASIGMTIGELSSIDSLQQDEERVLTAQCSTPHKKLKKKEQEKEFNQSPQSHSDEAVKVQEKDLGTSAERKSHKRKRVKMENLFVG